jgi:hypothetical protein
MARIAAEDKAREDLMKEVMSIREVQIRNRQENEAREKILDKVRVAKIKEEHAAKIQQELEEEKRKKEINIKYGLSLKDQLKAQEEYRRGQDKIIQTRDKVRYDDKRAISKNTDK